MFEDKQSFADDLGLSVYYCINLTVVTVATVATTSDLYLYLRTGWCLSHHKECDLKTRIGSIHIAGTPCTAYSHAGLMDTDTAESYAHFMSWCGLRQECQEPSVVQECTDEMPRDDFLSLLPMYHWDFIVLCPTLFGWPIRRRRQWAV